MKWIIVCGVCASLALAGLAQLRPEEPYVPTSVALARAEASGEAYQEPARTEIGWGNGTPGTWTFVVFPDDGGTLTVNNLPTQASCMDAAIRLARELPRQDAARLALRSSCFQRASSPPVISPQGIQGAVRRSAAPPPPAPRPYPEPEHDRDEVTEFYRGMAATARVSAPVPIRRP